MIAYGRNIDNLGVLASRVERIAQKHVGAEHPAGALSLRRQALLGAIKDVLGDAATEEVLEAWGEAYWFLADLLMAREANIYRPARGRLGRLERLARLHRGEHPPESEIIRSFILVPADGRGVMRHRPGQYLTFALDVPGAGHPQAQLLDLLRPGRPLLSHQRQARGDGRGAAGTRLELAARSRRTWHGAQGGAAGRRVLPG